MSRHPRPSAALVAGLLFPLAAHGSWRAAPLTRYRSRPAPGAVEGVRRFSHEEEHHFSDGSDLALRWEVDADPESILSLDLAHPDGLRMRECGPDSLVLEVSAAHLEGVNAWRHVVASGHLHSCGHLKGGTHLYHHVLRVSRVDALEPKSRGATVTLATRELASPSQVFKRLDLTFSFMPARAKTERPTKAKTEGRFMPPSAAPRRAQASWSFGGANVNMGASSDNVHLLPPTHEETLDEAVGTGFTDGGAQMGNSFAPTTEDVQSILNVKNPTHFSNLHWNWDENMNSTKNKEFEFKFPGGESWIRLYRPYLKAHVGLTVNYTTTTQDFFEEPQVKIKSKLQGYADLNADIATSADFQDNAAVDPLQKFTVPFIAQEASQLQPIKVYIGGTPVQIDPGFSCHLNAYHVGQMQGSLRVGLKTKLRINADMTFDTTNGLMSNASVEAMDVKLTPPTWMIFTRHFELGVMLEPEFWIKGGLGAMKDMKMGMGFRPYLNVSIMQEGEEGARMSETLNIKNLAIYPYRVVGLPDGAKYSVRVLANDWSKNTSAEASKGGVTEYHSRVSDFMFGPISEDALLSAPIRVEILKDNNLPYDDSPVASGEAHCTALVNGECSPSPLKVPLKVAGKDVTVFLSTAWLTDPAAHLQSKVQGIGVSVTRLTLTGDTARNLAKSAPSTAGLRVERNGQTFNLPLRVSASDADDEVQFKGLSVSRLGLRSDGSLASMNSAIGDVSDTKLALVVDGTEIGHGVLTPGSLMSAALEKESLDFTLFDAATEKELIGTGKMESDLAYYGGLSRRLQAQRPTWGEAKDGHRLSWGGKGGETSESDFAEHMAANAERCDAKPLRYSLGVGVLEETLMEAPLLAEVSPFLATGQSASRGPALPMSAAQPSAGFNEGYTPLMQEHLEDAINKLLPGSACFGGLCKGELPGCQPQAVTPIEIPHISFKLSRKFLIDEIVKPEMRRAFAYGLAVLPDSIKVGEEAAVEFPKAVMAAKIAAMAAAGSTSEEQARRLQSHGVETDTLRLQVTKPMLYKLDTRFVQKLVDMGAFNLLSDGRERTHGPVAITSFQLHRPEEVEQKSAGDASAGRTSSVAASLADDVVRQPSSSGASAGHASSVAANLAGGAVVGGAVFGLFVLSRRRHFRLSLLYAQEDEPDDGPLE